MTAAKLVYSTWKFNNQEREMEKRYIGIDLHRNRFTCCIRLENERTYVTEWELEDLGKFVKKLRPSDEVAVEITGNTQVVLRRGGAACGARGGGEHESVPVIRQSVKKTDPARRADAGVVLVEEHVAGGAHEG